MYVLAFDIGSTNIKALVLKVTKINKDENVDLIGKIIVKNTNFADFFYELIKKYDIDFKNIEKVVVTGTGASYLENKIHDIDIVKVDEFNAISYGGLLLSKLDKALIVSIGTGTTIVYSDLNENIRIGGTGLGGGTFVGLSNAIIDNRSDGHAPYTFNVLVKMASNGNRSNVDLCIGDISNTDILNMSKDITAANFAGINKKHNIDDLISAVANLVLENIALLVKTLNKDLPVVYIGTMVKDQFIKNRIKEIAEYTESDVTFVDDADFAIAIGAWEYYLLKIRKVI